HFAGLASEHPQIATTELVATPAIILRSSRSAGLASEHPQIATTESTTTDGAGTERRLPSAERVSAGTLDARGPHPRDKHAGDLEQHRPRHAYHPPPRSLEAGVPFDVDLPLVARAVMHAVVLDRDAQLGVGEVDARD